MRLKFCVACGENDYDLLQHHLVIPLLEGGCDEDANYITLCFNCHLKLYGKPFASASEKA